jgi:type VI secretion system secreted protein VgrG
MFHTKNILNQMMSLSFLASVGFVALLSLAQTDAALAATAPSLGTAATFAVLGGSTVTNTGSTAITGDLGVWPGLAITGFPPGTVTGTTHAGDAVALQAQSDVTTAYNDLAGQPCNTNLTGQDLGGMTLTPGAYCFSTSAQLTGTLTLNAQGSATAVFVFQIGSTLTTASNSSVLLINSGQSCNVFWQVGSSATLGTGTAFAGNILALTSITLNTNASMTGRALARNGAVTLDTNNINVSLCAAVCPEITLAPATLPSGNVGTRYSQTITASGGTAPYTFTVTAGSLPPGLTLTSSGPSSALLSGTPTTTGPFNFTVTARDANNCPGSQPYTVTIAVPVAPTAVPTLSEWGVIIFMVLVGLMSIYYLRRQKAKA